MIDERLSDDDTLNERYNPKTFTQFLSTCITYTPRCGIATFYPSNLFLIHSLKNIDKC